MFTCLLTYLLGTISVILAAIYLFYKHSYTYWEKLGVPFVQPRSIFGSMKESLTIKKTLGEVVLKWYEDHKKAGHDYVGLYFFYKPSLLLINPELVKNVMSKDFDHFVDRNVYCNEEDDPLSAHLFSLKGNKWKHLRQKMTPTFTSGKLKKMFQTLVDCTEALQNCLDESTSKSEPVEVKTVLAKYTTDVIGSVAFGIECNSFKDPNSDFIKYGSKVFTPKKFDRFKMSFSFAFPKFCKLLRMRITNRDVDHFYRSLVRDTVDYREKNNVVRNDFMQLLIQLKNKGRLEEYEKISDSKEVDEKLTMNEVAAQAFLFFLAGYETSSTTMTFCLYELAKNREIQDKAREEVVNVLKKRDGKLTYDSLMDMHYLEKVILETLRKHPPVMFLQRQVTKDYHLPDTSIVLPQGMMVFLPVLGLQYDPDFYPDPERFEPERFSEENKASRPDFTFLPFGDGPRVCIGLRFGMMQTKVGICRLLYNYRFKLNPKTADQPTLDPNTFVRSIAGGVWLDTEKI